jgi:hypothetical protein
MRRQTAPEKSWIAFACRRMAKKTEQYFIDNPRPRGARKMNPQASYAMGRYVDAHIDPVSPSAASLRAFMSATRLPAFTNPVVDLLAEACGISSAQAMIMLTGDRLRTDIAILEADREKTGIEDPDLPRLRKQLREYQKIERQLIDGPHQLAAPMATTR